MNQELITSDPFAELDQETVARMAKLRDQDSKPVFEAPVDLSRPPDSIPEEESLKETLESIRAELKKAIASKEKAIAQIAVLKAKSGGGTHFNPDGSMTLSVTIGQDTVLAMTQYQEFEGTSIEETLQKHIPLALEAYI